MNQWPIIFALLTGLFWGTYGPALGNARSAEKNAFKPYVMIGVAYLVWGLFGGLAGMAYTQTAFSFTREGAFWGFAAGSLGAFGALTLTLAMFSGGTAMPQVVMPIVFGTAVSVTAITSVLQTKASFNPWLWLGIAGMAVCIVLVAYNTPHAAPHKPQPPAPTPTAT
jgi:drug/metabolite transporter (DMT)-like permease